MCLALRLHCFNFLASCFVVGERLVSVFDHVLRSVGQLSRSLAEARYSGCLPSLGRKKTLGIRKAS